MRPSQAIVCDLMADVADVCTVDTPRPVALGSLVVPEPVLAARHPTSRANETENVTQDVLSSEVTSQRKAYSIYPRYCPLRRRTSGAPLREPLLCMCDGTGNLRTRCAMPWEQCVGRLPELALSFVSRSCPQQRRVKRIGLS